MFKTTLKSLSVLGLAVGLGAGQANAASIFSNEAAFLADAGTLGFESFESASLVSNQASINMGSFVAAGTNLGIRSGTTTSKTHATDGTQFLYSGGGATLTLTFTDAINSVGFYLTDLFWGVATGPAVTVTTNTGEVVNTGVTKHTSKTYVGLIADALFTSLTINLMQGDGVGLDSLSYGIASTGDSVLPVDNDNGNGGYENGGGNGGSTNPVAAPSPAAGLAGLALLGLLAARRRIA